MSGKNRRDPNLLAQIAYMREVKKLSQKEIGERLTPKRNQATVSRLLDEAWERKIVTYSFDPEAAIIGTEDEMLGPAVRDAFGLKKCLVVDSDDLSDPELVIALANHTARRTAIESGEHVAVAGGRTIVRLTTEISRNPPSVRDVMVTPLGGWLWSGRLWTLPHRGPNYLEQPLNPDYSALILAQGLYAGPQPGGTQPNIQFSQISHPLYAEDAKAAKKIMESTCAFLPGGEWNWNLKPPTKTYVGVGVVHPESAHRMIEVLQYLKQRGELDLPVNSAYRDLDDAMEFIKNKGLRYFGDVANRLYCSLPTPRDIREEQLSCWAEAYREAASRLDGINRRAVVMEWSHLRAGCNRNGIRGTVCAIAGGALKTDALWTLLLPGLISPEFCLVNSVTTDSLTARTLLEARRDYEQSTTDVKDWYAATVRTVFADDHRR